MIKTGWYDLKTNEKEDEIKVKRHFFHSVVPSSSFSYPRKSDILWVSLIDVFYKAYPTTPTGPIYVTTTKGQFNKLYQVFKIK